MDWDLCYTAIFYGLKFEFEEIREDEKMRWERERQDDKEEEEKEGVENGVRLSCV